jgi:hypothetical protein
MDAYERYERAVAGHMIGFGLLVMVVIGVCWIWCWWTKR